MTARRMVRSALYYTLAGYAMQVLGFGAGIVLARRLGPAEYGLYGIGMVIALFFSRAKLWGFNSLVIAETEADDELISTQFWMSIGFSGIVLLLLLAALPILNLLYAQNALIMAIAITGLMVFENEGVASTPENMLAREMRYGVISAAVTISTAFGLGISIVMAIMGYGAWSLLGGFAGKTVIYAGILWWKAPRRPGFQFSPGKARWLLGQGRFLWWGGIGTYLAYQYDDIAVATFTDQETLGEYRWAYNMALVPMSLVGGVMGVAAATYAQVKDDRAALTQAVTFILDAVALIALPASVGLALIAPEAVPLIYTEKWLPAVPMIQILLLYSLMRPLNDSVGSLAATLGLVQVNTLYGAVQSVIMLVGCTALTLIWGAHGAALTAGVAATAGMMVFYLRLLRPHVDVNYFRVFFGPTIASASGAAVALVGLSLWKLGGLLEITAFKSVVFSMVYVAVLLLIGRQSLIERVQWLIGVIRGQETLVSAEPDKENLS